jgi:mannosidase alpha-like ER degradation enhancer 2
MRPMLIPLLLPLTLSTAGAQVLTSDVMAERVKMEFVRAWNGYRTYAWGHDGFRPLSKTAYDWYGTPFYLTAIEALDTMTLMGLTAEADSTREFIATHLSFDKDVYVNVFEFTTRILGSLLANYQLSRDQRLLGLAEDLGKRMLPAFISGTGLPYREINLRTGAVRGEISNPAAAGTLLVEFGSLSAMTGKGEYYNSAKLALLALYQARSPIGLVGEEINVKTAEWTKTDSHLSAGIDSYYEYILKCGYLFDDADCRLMWQTHYEAINKYLLDSSANGFWYGHADMNTGKRTKTWFGALDAFFPACMALYGDVKRADMLLQSCFRMWNAFGVEPDQYNYVTGKAENPHYYLNPEIMESTYYLYQATGDPGYLSMGRVFFDSLVTYCRTDEGYAELENVVTKKKMDRMESYFMAETLKYLYLLFAPSEILPFNRVIFNTEGHPIRKAW